MPDTPATRKRPGPQPGFRKGPSLPPPEVLNARTPFARALVERRLQLGMTQRDLAQTSGVPETSVSIYESGDTRPGPRSRAKLELALGCELPPFEDQQELPLTPAQLEQAKRQLGIE